MRKFIFAIILMVLAVSLMAEEADSLRVEEAETPLPVFRLLSASQYDVNLRYYPHLQRIYVNMEFSVESDSLPEADYYSLFLNKAAQLEYVYVNDKFTPPVLAEGLVPEHYEPVLPQPELLSDSTMVMCSSFVLKGLMPEPGKIKFRIRYWIAEPEWQIADDGSSFMELLSDQFWFLRNIETASNVNVKLQSSTRYSLDINAPCLFTDVDGIRVFRGGYEDGPGKSIPIRIYKLN